MKQVEKKRQTGPSGFSFGKVKRSSHRKNISGFVGDIAGSSSLVGGDVMDISCGGFKMTGVPATFTAQKHTYTVVLSGSGKHYRLLARPCWQKKTDQKGFVEMGFKVIDAPWDWLDLTLNETSGFGFHA